MKLYWEAISTQERKDLKPKFFAGPHETFPIRPDHPEDVTHAAELLHHAADPTAVKANIIRLAHEFGHPLPATWSHDSAKADSVSYTCAGCGTTSDVEYHGGDQFSFACPNCGLAIQKLRSDTKHWFCDRCDSAFAADEPEMGSHPLCPKCDSSKAVSELGNATDSESPKRKAVREFHEGLKGAIDAKNTSVRDEHSKLKGLAIKLCPDYGGLSYDPEGDAYHLCTSDSDDTDSVNDALSKISDVVGKERLSSEAEHTPSRFTKKVAEYGHGDWQNHEDRIATQEDLARFGGEGDLKKLVRASNEVGAHEAATSPLNDKDHPSEAQQRAGNYSKGHIKVGGLGISIENPSGSRRRPEWGPLSDHYGYIKGTVGADKDHLDAFVKPGTMPSFDGPVHVVNQTKDDGSFDEHKVMLGWPDATTARAGYLSNYTPDQAKNVHSVVTLSLDNFKKWASDKSARGPSGGPLLPNITDRTDSLNELSAEAPGEGSPVFKILARDGQGLRPGELMRVRQAATRADALNGNNRVLLRGALIDAIRDARERVRAGVMHSELRHPDSVLDSKGQERFVDNPDEKTARVDDIEEPDANGWVWIVRTILDTKRGRQLAARFKNGNPPGISTRYGADGVKKRVGGVLADVLHKIKIYTFDDVENPAFADAGKGRGMFQLLTDSEKEEAGLPASPSGSDPEATDPNAVHEILGGSPESAFNTSNPNSLSPVSDPSDFDVQRTAGDSSTRVEKRAQETKVKNEKIRNALAAFTDAVAASPKNDSEIVMRARRAAQDAILQAMRDGEDIKGAPQAYITAETNMEIAGFRPDGPIPMAILGSATGTSPDDGYATDADGKPATNGLPKQIVPPKKSDDDMVPATSLLKDAKDIYIENLMKREAEAAEKKLLTDAVERALDGSEEKLANLGDEAREFVLDHVRSTAKSAEDVPSLMDAAIVRVSKLMSDAAIEKRGYFKGKTVTDTPNIHGSRGEVVQEAAPWRVPVEKLVAVGDEMLRTEPRWGIDPDAVREGRAYRKKTFIDPLIEQLFVAKAANDKTFASLMTDSIQTHEKNLEDACRLANFADATTLSNLYNQPSVIAMIIVQMFQDTRFLSFYQAFGRGVNDKGVKWGEETDFGNIVKIAVEYFANPPSQYQTKNASSGAKYAENTAIDEAQVLTNWLTFYTQFRKGGISVTREGIRALGGGSLNYDTVARHLTHLGWYIARMVDKDLADEMPNVSDEYLAVVNTGDSYTTGGGQLTGLSVYNAAGSVGVNLNPTKTANTTLATTDPSVFYGPTVIAAVKLRTRGNGNSSPYNGLASNGINDPIVRPRTQYSNTSQGQTSSSVLNPFTITVPAGLVQGYLSDSVAGADIVSFPGTVAQFAVDWENGVVVFNAASSIAGSTGAGGINGGIITTTPLTFTYSYATNFDVFTLTQSLATITGYTGYEDYLTSFFTQISRTAAYMGSSSGTGEGRFVKPDLGVCSLNVAALLESARIFEKFRSPKSTELYPSEEFFVETRGINFARHNTPWLPGDKRLILGRRGAGKYGLELPLQMIGPVTPTNSTGQVFDRQTWLASQNEILCTPQATDQSGNVINPVYRSIKLI